MTKTEIIAAAVQAEALKRGIVDKDLISHLIDLYGKDRVRVENGEAVASDVTKLVAEMREAHPAVFVTPDANKLSEADFEKLENELRKGNPREIEKPAAYVRQIDASELDEQENEALGKVLRGSKQSYDHGILERAARRQGLNVTPAAA